MSDMPDLSELEPDPPEPTPLGVLYRVWNLNRSVYLDRYPILKLTPKGYWIRDWGARNQKRFVGNNTRKRYAWPTPEEAKQSFIARKRRQIRYIRAHLEHTECALTIALEDNITQLWG